MAKFNKFRKGASTFVCECCGHHTRETGQALGAKICYACFELAGLENMLSDDGEEQFAKVGADEVKSWMNEIRKRSEAEFERAKESFSSLAPYFPSDEDFTTEAPLLATQVATDHSVKGAVAICKAILAANPQITRKAFIAEAGKQGVIKATAGTQFARIKKGA
ncbi:hypothetical protein EVC17_010 [Rhizobium phage RHph_Y1_1]|nr:hypothetical protein EVB80_010 [Rhizobium phage RHph_I36]QIG75367.1 hypothetical protein EVC17_010 [Rhizobium phage RHph_Y1_1]QIG75917.1 hypothetical protein EVC21_010 [Rhizobium phage RHph_Y2_17_2]